MTEVLAHQRRSINWTAQSDAPIAAKHDLHLLAGLFDDADRHERRRICGMRVAR